MTSSTTENYNPAQSIQGDEFCALIPCENCKDEKNRNLGERDSQKEVSISYRKSIKKDTKDIINSQIQCKIKITLT